MNDSDISLMADDSSQNRIYRIHPHREGLFAAAVASAAVIAIWRINNHSNIALLILPIVAYLAAPIEENIIESMSTAAL